MRERFEQARVCLEALVQKFEADAARNRDLMRDLLNEDRELFLAGAVDILKTADDSRGAQQLVAILAADNLLVAALCDPALNLDLALALARRAARGETKVDVMIARAVADNAAGMDEGVRDPMRLLEILSAIANPARVRPYLLRLLRYPDPVMQSKVVKMIGSGGRNPQWVRDKLNDPDARVRANAVESLWGFDSPEARAVFLLARKDETTA
jgi:hypothetical protein